MDIEKATKIIKYKIKKYKEELEIELEDKIDEPRIAYLLQQKSAMETVLSELERLQNNEEILNGELARIGIETLGLEEGSSTDDIITEIKKRDKIIDLMAKEIYIETDKYENPEEVKRCFERKVENGN